MFRKATAVVFSLIVCFGAVSPAAANTYGSVEPIPSTDVADSQGLRAQPLAVRQHVAEMIAACGAVDDVMNALSSTGAIPTINDLNTSFAIGAGGFAGETNASYVFTFIDDGPNAAARDDIAVLTNALAYVLSQDSAFLLDADDPESFDFPANYVVVNFPTPPSIEQSAALFEAVGDIDPELFATDTSGYTQYGRAYLSLQSDVDDAQFIAGYREAAELLDLEYTPVIDGAPSLFRGGAAFPGNDWNVNTSGEEYLARIPQQSRGALAPIRDRHLRLTESVLGIVADHEQNDLPVGLLRWRLRRVRCE